MTEQIPIVIIVLPLIAAFLQPLMAFFSFKTRDAMIIALLLAVNVMLFYLIPPIALAGKTMYYTLGAADPRSFTPQGLDFPIRIVLKIDAFSLFTGIIVGIVTITTFLFSAGCVKNEESKKYFTTLFLLFTSGLLGMSFTNDLFNFFVFLEIASISGAALVAYDRRSKHSPYAAYKYILISTIATTFFLFGVALCYAQYGSFNIQYIHSVLKYSYLDKIALIFILLAMAMKAGAVPMHFWVPDTYSEAPAPVSAMLKVSGMVSLCAMFKFAFTLFGPSANGTGVNYQTLGWIIIVLGVLSMFIGVTMALIQHDVRRLMAFHAVSQTGYMLLGVGVGIAVMGGGESTAFKTFGKIAITGGIFHIMNNAFYKNLLFLTSGVMERRFGTRNLNSMIGMGHGDTLTTVVFMIGALAIAGIPPFNGFDSKLMIYESVYKFSPTLAIIAIFVSVMTLASFMKVFYSAFMGPGRDDLIVDKEPLTVTASTGLIVLAILIVAAGLFPGLVIDYIVQPAVEALTGIR